MLITRQSDKLDAGFLCTLFRREVHTWRNTMKKKVVSKKKSVKKKAVAKRKVVAKKRVAKKKVARKRQERTWLVARKKMTREKIKVFVCDQLRDSSRGLRNLCDEINGMPDRSTIHDWLSKDSEFSDLYARARVEQAEFMAEEILEIADDGRNDFMEDDDGFRIMGENIQRSKVRIDARKWLMGKLKPRKYGDRLDVNVTEDKLEGKTLVELKAMAAEYATREV